MIQPHPTKLQTPVRARGARASPEMNQKAHTYGAWLSLSLFFIENVQNVIIYQNNSNHSKKQRTEETHMHGPKTQLNYN